MLELYTQFVPNVHPVADPVKVPLDNNSTPIIAEFSGEVTIIVPASSIIIVLFCTSPVVPLNLTIALSVLATLSILFAVAFCATVDQCFALYLPVSTSTL